MVALEQEQGWDRLDAGKETVLYFAYQSARLHSPTSITAGKRSHDDTQCSIHDC